MAVKARQPEQWELAAENLVRQVRVLLDSDGAIEEALIKASNRDQACAQLEQLDAFCTALELELWRVADAPRKHVAVAALSGLRGAARTVATVLLTLGSTQLYEMVFAVEKEADSIVVQCDISEDVTISRQPIPVMVDNPPFSPRPAAATRHRGGGITAGFSQPFYSGAPQRDDLRFPADANYPSERNFPGDRPFRSAAAYEVQHGRLDDENVGGEVRSIDDAPDVLRS